MAPHVVFTLPTHLWFPSGDTPRAALESRDGVITLCLTLPLTHRPGCEDRFSCPPPSFTQSWGG